MRSHERNYDANIEAKICIAMDFLFNLYMFNSIQQKSPNATNGDYIILFLMFLHCLSEK